jgi:vitamin B12 transporter
VNWRRLEHNIVLGADFDSKEFESNTIAGQKHTLRKYAYYVNDTVSFNRFSVTPGIRRDETNTSGGMTSPSLGMTYKPADTVLLRAYAARGFSIPPLASTFGDSLFAVSNPDLRMEKVDSFQVGAETTALPYLWLKFVVYRNDISDAITNIGLPSGTFMAVNSVKARKEGLEIEVKTRPVYNTSLFAGAAFMNTKDLATGRTMPDSPQRTYDAGIEYDDASLKALLKGHYIHWNSDPSAEGKYDSMIFDLHASQAVFQAKDSTLELFGTIHNIFNGDQYRIAPYTNPKRWAEGGLRFIF